MILILAERDAEPHLGEAIQVIAAGIAAELEAHGKVALPPVVETTPDVDERTRVAQMCDRYACGEERIHTIAVRADWQMKSRVSGHDHAGGAFLHASDLAA